MNLAVSQSDLVVLVPDKSIECALCGLLTRPRALQIRPVRYELFVHPERDPACLRKAAAFLRPHSQTYRYALVVFDREGSGGEECSRESLEEQVENALGNAGWAERCAAVVIDPELESWVWSDSPQVSQVLGWQESLFDMREWLGTRGIHFAGTKPVEPKLAMETVLRHVGKAWSSTIFRQLARRVGLQRCNDPAFAKLRRVLQRWFPQDPERPGEETVEC